LSSKGVRGTNKISCCFKKGHRGAIINIVASQKMASRCNHKYRGATKVGLYVCNQKYREAPKDNAARRELKI